MDEPIPVPTLSKIVTCETCKKNMIISESFVVWRGHPGWRHYDGHPDCNPEEI